MTERLSTKINKLQSRSMIGFCKDFNMNDNYAGTTMLMYSVMSMSTVQLFDFHNFFRLWIYECVQYLLKPIFQNKAYL